MIGKNRPAGAAAIGLLAGLGVLAMPGPGSAQDLAITEFLALNDGGLRDEDGDQSDWIEIQNLGAETVDLDGWVLTDRVDDPWAWRFPSMPLEPGAFVVVFASGKDRAVAGRELHTNFRLDGGGEYLALISPLGFVVHEFAPAYPIQHRNFSYGLVRGGVPVLAAGTEARIRVPSDGSEGDAWIAPDYDDSGWMAAATGLGFHEGGGSPPEYQDLAPGGTATQSSTYANYEASRAIDGSLSSFSHTTSATNLPSTWQLDLGGTYAIRSVVLHNRTTCCQSRLRDITILVLDEAGEIAFISDLLNPENVLGGGGTTGPATIELDILQTVGALIAGRTIRIVRTPDPDLSGIGGSGTANDQDVLTLAEVEVWGADVSYAADFGPLIAADLSGPMRGTSASVFVRIPFAVGDPAALSGVMLRMRYDDGFIAHLNGIEVARRNAPDPAPWDAEASAENPNLEAVIGEVLPIARERLRSGWNVLAIHGLNRSAADGDFLLLPTIDATSLGLETPRYFRTPTPGAPNPADGIAGFVADTKFEPNRGFQDSPIDVEITTETPGARIRYTVDGTPPSATSGTIYTGPIHVAKTTAIRAIAYTDGLEPTNVDTHTYIFLDDVILQDYAATVDAGFSTSWGGTAPDYGFDMRVIGQGGTDQYGGKYARTIRDDLKAIPTMSIVVRIDDLFGAQGIYVNTSGRGEAYERPASVELICPDGSQGFQIDAGIRIQGGAFRSHGLTKKHSFRLLFKGIYGATKLEYPLFGRKAPDRFDTLVLRSNANDAWTLWSGGAAKALYIRDEFGRATTLAMGGVASHGVFVHLYINGIYWGLYNPCERPDHAFSATYFGGDKENWDAINSGTANEGDLTAWNRMVGLAQQGLASDAAYYAIQGRNPDGSPNSDLPDYLDVENNADYMITNLYVGNTDWPHKNYWVGYDRVEPKGFKFYMWDSEWSMGIQSDVNTNQVGVSNGVAAPWAALRQNAEFRMLVADRLHRCFFNGGALYVDTDHTQWDPDHPERNVPAARFAALAAQIDRAIVAETARWGDQLSGTLFTRDEHWAVERDNLLANYFPRRSANVLAQFKAAGLYPDIEAPVFSQHGGVIPEAFELAIDAAAGLVLYTLDGSDPRLPGGAISPLALPTDVPEPTLPAVLIDEEAQLLVLVPQDGTLGLAWTDPAFDDGPWRDGTMGVGYEHGSGYEALIGTDVEAEMYGANGSVYIRTPFTVDAKWFDGGTSRFQEMTLRVKYDDGYVAYLNGERVAARNAPAAVDWNSGASTGHSDAEAVVYEDVDLSGAIGRLRPGANVLAIHGLNNGTTSTDFLIAAMLVASEASLDPPHTTVRVPIEGTTFVRARTYWNGRWSAIDEALFRPDIPIRITEIMYHPRPEAGIDGDAFEFIELQNIGAEPFDLSGLALSGGIWFVFPEGTLLAPGAFALVVANPIRFAWRYPQIIDIVGAYDGQLSNAGETVSLLDEENRLLLSIPYEDMRPWPEVADGEGHSIVPVDPRGDGDPAQPDAWRASKDIDGSPGRDDDQIVPIGGLQRPGDLNQDGDLHISDAIAILGYLFGAGPAVLPCSGGPVATDGDLVLVDVNADGQTDLGDGVYLLSYLFANGPPPARGTECIEVPGCPDACPR
ncbi:MAG: lamin tail domain-containing protein [Planctomycetes bacterium]|nr:lamin tail domain-containing protein [Planctomycetota bacterium]